jgi:hypothetical protein
MRADISAISAGQAEFEEKITDKPDKQMKYVGTIVEPQTQKPREEFNSQLEETRRNIGVAGHDIEATRDILEAVRRYLEATRREFVSQPDAVEARTVRGSRNLGTSADMVKPPKFD